MSIVNLLYHAEPRSYYPKFEDSELQSCMQELAEHLTDSVSYNAEDVLKDGSSVITGCFGACNARMLYEGIREAHKATERQMLAMTQKFMTEMTEGQIKNLREGFEFNPFETMQQVTQICSFAVLEGITWQELLR